LHALSFYYVESTVDQSGEQALGIQNIPKVGQLEFRHRAGWKTFVHSWNMIAETYEF